ncbi:class D beta-lactamase [Campylobacter sp. MIT 99-7217]|uniref:class D beta-lactamase n=1 Tax=Campylobacter sp. MIT 99-7217 TaxID=535091 RepID=UPI001156E7B5|nr:class D beta-lactamase [Campylobacter sp. MIT 99-7217]TQR32334.1 class D beta-lactamase [Campylobacter sp. MIT 99-7217]
MNLAFKKIFIFLLFLSVLKADENLKDLFKDMNLSGVLISFDGLSYKSNDFKRANQAFSPASTFKIANALIALDNGVIKDANEVFYIYKGEKVFLQSWAQDANLSTAMKNSAVPAFKELARKIGLKKMKEGLKKLAYGNEKISLIDEFWLDDSLKISAKEQVDMLFALMRLDLPFSKKAQEEVIKTLELKSGIYAKTGFNDKIGLAWIIGFVKQKKLAFAMNLDIKDFEDLPKRELLLENALQYKYF